MKNNGSILLLKLPAIELFRPNSVQSFIYSDFANMLVDEHNQVFIACWKDLVRPYNL
jgi:hypothetical protein